MNTELNTPELIAQWVIDNRYPKSQNEKTDDREMYTVLTESISALLPSELLKQRDELKYIIQQIIDENMPLSESTATRIKNFIESNNP